MPKRRAGIEGYTQGFRITRTGVATDFQIKTSHDVPLETLLSTLHSNAMKVPPKTPDEEGPFIFEKHPHQTWDFVKSNWLRGSNPHADKQALMKAILDNPKMRQPRQAGATLDLVWAEIHNFPNEILDWRDRTYAWHVYTPKDHYHMVSIAILST